MATAGMGGLINIFNIVCAALMAVCAVFLYPSSVIPFRLEVALLVCAGVIFSWFFRSRPRDWLHIAVPVSIIGIFVWSVITILNSNLGYREMIIILLKSLVFVEIAVGFALSLDFFIPYMQLFSIPLFVGHALFLKEYDPVSILFVTAYLCAMIVSLRLKAYSSAFQRQENLFFHSSSVAAFIAVFAAVLAIAGVLSSAMPLSRSVRSGILAEDMEHGTKRVYDDSKDTVVRENTAKILDLRSKDRRIEALKNLNELIDDSSVTIEVDEAKNGLISQLWDPGPGEKDMNLEQRRHLQEFTDVRVKREMNLAQEELSKRIRDNILDLSVRKNIMDQVHTIKKSVEFEDLRVFSPDKALDKGMSLSKPARQEAVKQLTKLKDWKIYDIYRRRAYSVNEKIGSLSASSGKRAWNIFRSIEKSSDQPGLADLQDELDSLREEDKSIDGEIYEALTEMIDSRRAMMISGAADIIERYVQTEAYLPYSKIEEIGSAIKGLCSSHEPSDFAAGASALRSVLPAGDKKLAADADKLIALQGGAVFGQSVKTVDKIMSKSADISKGAKYSSAVRKLRKSRSRAALKRRSSVLKAVSSLMAKDGLIKKSDLKALDDSIDGAESALSASLEFKGSGESAGDPAEGSPAEAARIFLSSAPSETYALVESSVNGGVNTSGSGEKKSGRTEDDPDSKEKKELSGEIIKIQTALDPKDFKESVYKARELIEKKDEKTVSVVERIAARQGMALFQKSADAFEKAVDNAGQNSDAEALKNDYVRMADERSATGLSDAVEALSAAVERLSSEGKITESDKDAMKDAIRNGQDSLTALVDTGGSGPSGGNGEPGIPLVSVKLSPSFQEIYMGEMAVLPRVTGFFADKTTSDLTDMAGWEISDRSVAVIDAGAIVIKKPGRARVTAVVGDVTSSPSELSVKGPRLVSIIALSSRSFGDMFDKFELTAEGVYSDSSRRDLTASVLWTVADRNVVSLRGSTLIPQNIGKTEFYARSGQIVSLSSAVEVRWSLRWAAWIALWCSLFVFITLAAFGAVMFLMIDERRSALMKLSSNPGDFICAVYGNLRMVLGLAGVRSSVPNITYAGFAVLAGSVFPAAAAGCRDLTALYEEARFRGEKMSADQVSKALDQYHLVLREVLKQSGKRRKFLVYAGAFIKMKPLFLGKIS